MPAAATTAAATTAAAATAAAATAAAATAAAGKTNTIASKVAAALAAGEESVIAAQVVAVAEDEEAVGTDSNPTDVGSESPASSSSSRRGVALDASSAASQLAAQSIWLLGVAAIPVAVTAGSAPLPARAAAGDDPVDAATADAGNSKPSAASALSALAVATMDAAAAAIVSDASSGGNPPHGTSPDSSTDLTALASLIRTVPPGSPQIDGSARAIAVPVFDATWPHALAAQVQLLASSNVQTATLRLSPEHLGPVEVQIDLQSNQVNVNFVAAHPDTRSALEQSVPTLRAMFAQGGLTLGQTHVQAEARSGSQSQPGGARHDESAAATEAPLEVSVARDLGLVDEYA
jgi:flagellar hook-length control protein FliK